MRAYMKARKIFNPKSNIIVVLNHINENSNREATNFLPVLKKFNMGTQHGLLAQLVGTP